GSERDPDEAVADAKVAAEDARQLVIRLRADLEEAQSRKETLVEKRDVAASTLASARAELSGIEHEYSAFQRDREARARQAANKHGLPAALDRIGAEKGYERALAAVLGRDAKAPLGSPQDGSEGRYWTGSPPPAKV